MSAMPTIHATGLVMMAYSSGITHHRRPSIKADRLSFMEKA